MKEYFLHNGTEQQGPFSLDELKLKSINKDTPIWHNQLTDWTTADKIEELQNILRVSTPPPLNKQKPEQKTAALPQKKGSNITIWSILQILAGLFLASLLIMFFIENFNSSSSTSGETYEQKVMTVEEIERATPTDFLKASGTYKENFWGNKFNINVVITNEATVATYKDAIIRITYYSKTKTEIVSKDYTIYEIFPPTSSKTVELKIDNYQNVNSLGWDVISATAN